MLRAMATQSDIRRLTCEIPSGIATTVESRGLRWNGPHVTSVVFHDHARVAPAEAFAYFRATRVEPLSVRWLRSDGSEARSLARWARDQLGRYSIYAGTFNEHWVLREVGTAPAEANHAPMHTPPGDDHGSVALPQVHAEGAAELVQQQQAGQRFAAVVDQGTRHTPAPGRLPFGRGSHGSGPDEGNGMASEESGS